MALSMIVCLPLCGVPTASIQRPEQGSVNHPRGAIFWMTLGKGGGGCVPLVRALGALGGSGCPKALGHGR
jgi:hypothetical protein